MTNGFCNAFNNMKYDKWLVAKQGDGAGLRPNPHVFKTVEHKKQDVGQLGKNRAGADDFVLMPWTDKHTGQVIVASTILLQ